MLYCDLTLDSTVLWSGVACMHATPVKSTKYIPFTGNMFFVDAAGSADPNYKELMTRFYLIYLNASNVFQFVIPLQPVPSQQLAIVLSGQNCVLSVYEGSPE